MSVDTQLYNKLLMCIPFIPLLGSLIVYFLTNSSEKSHKLSGWLATIFSALTFGVVLQLFFYLQSSGAESFAVTCWEWINVQPLHAAFSFRFDHLSAVMCLVITGIGSLIHLYAIEYMDHDEHRPRFFAYLNLFLFSMLLLVLGDNLLVMFVGWEGVGLCSYLLIGFWFKEMDNAKAGQKAFVVNRIGDAGFILGIFLIVLSAQTIDFASIQLYLKAVPPEQLWVFQLAALLLFVGAMGKSAQVPLYIWLPDAMAGPTPVSALIHAATMVTAGVYMITRLHFLFIISPTALFVISVVGCVTAFLAASIALVQNDIKKVLAYSTVSQLGYMFMALGAGAFSNGMYHVVTHAFFKACLFLGAGSVILGCHHEQDMRHFGGLWKKMPVTCITYFCATIAIAGIPFTSGFFSKDAILWTVYSNPYIDTDLAHILWGFGAFTALMTAFYMMRSFMLTFTGSYRGHHEAHESGFRVLIPLIILAVPSLVFGYLWGEKFLEFLIPWTTTKVAIFHHQLEGNHTYHFLERFSSAIAIVGVLSAVLIYGLLPAIANFFRKIFAPIYQLLLNKWWVDELFNAIIITPLHFFFFFLFKILDRSFIDGVVNGSAIVVDAEGEMLRRMQTGRLNTYVLSMFIGSLVIIVFWFLL